MPEESYLYALPYTCTKSTASVVTARTAPATSINPGSGKNAEQTGRRTEHHHRHLGNGGSVSAIRNGKCVDTLWA